MALQYLSNSFQAANTTYTTVKTFYIDTQPKNIIQRAIESDELLKPKLQSYTVSGTFV